MINRRLLRTIVLAISFSLETLAQAQQGAPKPRRPQARPIPVSAARAEGVPSASARNDALLAFEWPENGEYVKNPAIAVRVRARDSIVSLSVNGVSAARDRDGVFVAAPVALAEGPLTLTAVATDRAGATDRATIHIVSDRTPPRLIVSQGGSGLTPGAEILSGSRIQIETADASPVSITATLNGKPFESGTEIVPKGHYTLRLEASDRAGNFTRQSLSFQVVAASVRISNVTPPSGTLLADSQITISGDCEGAASVTVAGVGALLHRGRFAAAGVPVAPGINRIAVVARDGADRENREVLEIVRDDAPPQLTISSPSFNYLTRSASVVVRGHAVDPHLAKVEVGGAPAKIAGASFERDVRLAEGPNRIVVAAQDSAGNRTEAPIDVFRDSTAPAVSITAPGPGTIVGAAAIEVSGYAFDADLARVVVNGTPARLRGSRYVARGVALTRGENRIVVTATDRAGNSSRAVAIVVRDDEALPLTFELPRSVRAATEELVGSIVGGGSSPLPEGLRIEVNGISAEIEGERFRLSGVPLVHGSNSLIVRASDVRGRTAVTAASVRLDGEPPQLLSADPAQGAAGVPPVLVARLTFSKPLDPATVTSGSARLLSEAGEPVRVTISGEGRNVAIFPEAPLAWGSAYRLELAGSITDRAGNPLGMVPPIRFTTASASRPSEPRLDPVPAALCASTLTISGRTDPGARLRVSGGASPGSALATAAGDFSVRVPLREDSLHVLSIEASDARGRSSPAATRIVRSDCTKPRVQRVQIDPDKGTLEIAFDKPIDPATLARDGAVIVTRPPLGIIPIPPLKMDASGRVARSDPSDGLRGADATVAIAPEVSDLAGNRLGKAHVTSTLAVTGAGQAGIFGQVFDDRIGRPLSGVSVTVVAVDGAAPTPPAPTATSAPDGTYSVVTATGQIALRAALDGYTAALRIGNVAPGDSIGVFDVRLTPEQIVTAAANGSATVMDAELTLSLPASSVPGGSLVRVAALSPQALPALPPLGWAPAAALSVELGPATSVQAPVTTFPAPLSASWTNRFAYATGTPLVLAYYEVATRRYLGSGSATLSTGAAQINASIGKTGVYVVLVADPAPFAPPAAVTGQPLAGVAPPGTDPIVSATVTTTPADVLPTQTADVTAKLTLSSPVPSGTAVEVVVAETLTLVNAQQVQSPSFVEDLTVLRDGAGQFLAPFRVRPSSTAAQVALSVGYENLSVKRYGFDLPRGNLVGVTGGTVTGTSGFTVVIAANALSQTVPVTMTALASASDVPLPIPAGYQFLAATQLSMGGQTLAAPANLKWASATDPTGNGLVWISVEDVNGLTRPRFAGPGRYDTTNHLVECTPATVHNLSVPGVVRGGLYVLLKAQAPLSYVKGRVLDVNGTTPVAAAVVTEDGTSVVAVTDGLGAWALPIPAAGGTVRSLRVDTGNVGQATVPSQAAGATATKDITLGVSAPYVLSVSPAIGSLLPLDLPIVFTLSEPLNPATVGPASVTASVGLVAIGGTARLSASGTQVTFTPSGAWPGKSSVQLKLSSLVTDLQGYRLVDGVTRAIADYVVTFTTVDPTPPTDINPLLIYTTLPAGVPSTTTLAGTSGAACGGCTVIAVNDTTTATATAIAAADGSFTLTLLASSADRVYVIIRRPGGAEIRVDPGPFREDGGRVAYLGARAADYLTRDGIRVTVDDGSYAAPVTVRVKPIALASLPAPLPAQSAFVAAIEFDPGDAVAARPIDFVVSAPPGVTGGQFLVARAVQVAGETRWMVVDTARYDNGAITTRPPSGLGGQGKHTAGSVSILSTTATVDCPGLAQPGGGKGILDRVIRKSNIVILGVQQQLGFLASAVVTPNVAVSFLFSGQYSYLQDIFPYVWVAKEARQQCYFAMPVPLNVPLTLWGRDATSGLTVFQAAATPVTDPNNFTTAPAIPSNLPDPRLMSSNVLAVATFVPVPTAPLVSRPLLSGISYTFPLSGTSGTLTVTGAAAAVEGGANVWLINNSGTAGSVSVAAGSDGSFTVALTANVVDDLTLAIGTKSLAPTAQIRLFFSAPMTQAASDLVTLKLTDNTAIPFKATLDTGGRGVALAPYQAFPAGKSVILTIPAKPSGLLAKPVTVTLGAVPTNLVGARDVKDVNAFYLKGGLLLEVTTDAGNLTPPSPGAKLNLYDATDPGVDLSTKLCSSLTLYDYARGVTMDDHDRILVSMGGGGTNGRVQVFRLAPPTGTGLCGGRVLIGEGTNPGDLDRSWTDVTVRAGAGNLGVLPEGFPRRIETIYRETRQTYVVDRDTALPQFVTSVVKTDVSPADGKQDANASITFAGQIPGSGVSPSPLNQPATLWNQTTGQLWTSYANASGNFTLAGKASSGDRLEIRVNGAEVAIVGTTGFGIQAVDVNKTVHLSGQDCVSGGTANDICDASKRLLFSFGRLTDLSPPLCRNRDGSGNCTDAVRVLDSLVDMAVVPAPTAGPPGSPPAPGDPAEATILGAINRFGLATFSLSGADENVRINQLGPGVLVATFDNPPIYPNFFAISASRGFPVKDAARRKYCASTLWKSGNADYRPTLAFLASNQGVFVVDVTKASVGGAASAYPEPSVLGLFRLPSGSATTLSLDPVRGILYVGSDGTSGQISAYDMTDPCTLDLAGHVAPATDPRRIASIDLPNENTNTAFAVDAETGIVFGAGDSTNGGNGRAFAVSLFGPPLRFVADTDHDGRLEEVGEIIPLGVENPKKPAAPYPPDVVRVLANLWGHAGSELVVEVSSAGSGGVGLSALPTGFPRVKTYLALKRQSSDPADPGYNRYLSPPIVLIADPRARKDYARALEEEPALPPRLPTWDDYVCHNCKLDTGYAAELSAYALDTEGAARAAPARASVEHWAGERLVARLAESAAAETSLKGLDTYLAALDLKQVKVMVGLTRGDLTPALEQPPAQNSSFLTTEAGVAVATHSGEAQAAWSDLAIKGRGLDFVLTRNYVSDVLHAGPFGRNLDSPLFARLRALPTGDVDFYPGDGARHTFRFVPTAGSVPAHFAAPAGVFLELHRNTDLTFALVYPDKTQLFFDMDGRLTKLIDRQTTAADDSDGNQMKFSYDGGGRLVAVADPTNRQVRFDYYNESAAVGSRGRISQVTDFDGRSVNYTYDTDGRLTKADGPDPASTASAKPSSLPAWSPATGTNLKQTLYHGGELRSLTDGLNREVFHAAYQVSAPATVQTVTLGGGTWQLGYSGLITTVTDPNSNPRTYDHLAAGQAKTVTEPRGAKTSYNYDIEGRLTDLTRPMGGGVNYTYDPASPTSKLAMGNVRTITELPRPGSAEQVAGKSLITSIVYQPATNLPISLTAPDGAITAIDRDAKGNPKTVTLPDNSTREFGFDSHGLLTSSKDGSGVTESYTYFDSSSGLKAGYLKTRAVGTAPATIYDVDPRGNVTTVTDPLGHSTSYQVNKLDQVEQESRAGSVTKSNFNAAGQVTYRDVLAGMDASNNSIYARTTYTVDETGRLRSRSESNGTTSSLASYAYDLAGNIKTISRTDAPTTTFGYDSRNRLTSMTTGSATTQYGYDEDNIRISSLSPRLFPTTYLIDGFGRSVGVLDATDVKTREILDLAGRSTETRTTRVSGTTETLYRWTQRQYDPAGRVKTEIRKLFTNPITVAADGSIPVTGVTDVITTTTYDGNGNVASVTDPLLHTTRNVYDARGRLATVTDAAGDTIDYTYDDANNKLTETVTELKPTGGSESFVTKFAYDGQNRLTKATDPLLHDTLYEYDPRGNRTKVTDVELNVSTAVYDLLGRKTQEKDSNGGTTNYEYDLSGHLTALVDANLNRIEFAYDSDGRLKQEKRADLKLWTYGYDAEGNRTTSLDPNGTTVTTTFDAVGRVTRKDVARGAGVLGPTRLTFGLDPLGRITSSSTSGDTVNVVEAFAYDSLDRLLSEQQQVGTAPNRAVTKGYDRGSNLNALTYPSGLALTYDIDVLNRIAAVKQGGTAIVSYRDTGARPFDRTFANGIVQTWSYDPGRRLTDILSKKGTTTVSDIAYTLSNLGNKQTISRPDLAKKATYTFNPNSWITQEALNLPIAGGTPERQTDYTIDKVLNYSQIQERVNGTVTATKSQTINNRNQYMTFAGAALSYDPNGNLLGGAGLGGTFLAYDFENRLKKATLASGTVVENIYDAQGRKVRESTTVSGTTKSIDYVSHGDQVLEQYTGVSLSARYVHGRGIDETVRAELDVDANGTVETTVFPLQDDLGNVERLTNAAGALVERYDYQGYGKFRLFDALGGASPISLYGWRRLFQGREYQPTLDVYDFRARTLLPVLGRFAQEDPIRNQSALASSQALTGSFTVRTDPLGLYELDFHFYAVFYLGRAAGLTFRRARKLAWASQYVDNYSWTEPVRNSPFSRRAQTFHFLARGQGLVQRDNPIAQANVGHALHARSLIALGIALHSLADSFAHEGFSSYYDSRNNPNTRLTLRPPMGHGATTEGGHYPDKPYHDVAKALEAARIVFDVLQIAASMQTNPLPARSWDEVRSRIRHPIAAAPGLDHGPADKRELLYRTFLWQKLIRNDFSDNIDYPFPAEPGWRREFDDRAYLQDSFVAKLEELGDE